MELALSARKRISLIRKKGKKIFKIKKGRNKD
jgi:hypothetical protein